MAHNGTERNINNVDSNARRRMENTMATKSTEKWAEGDTEWERCRYVFRMQSKYSAKYTWMSKFVFRVFHSFCFTGDVKEMLRIGGTPRRPNLSKGTWQNRLCSCVNWRNFHSMSYCISFVRISYRNHISSYILSKIEHETLHMNDIVAFKIVLLIYSSE